MREASKAMDRRTVEEYGKYFAGYGIDVGCGDDPVDQWMHKFTLMTGCKHWDMPDGDAQKLESVPYKKYDWLHSSHSLEHMKAWDIALKRWCAVVKIGGYVIVTVPSWEMYEHKIWPSLHNWDHKWSFSVDVNETAKNVVHLTEENLSRFGNVVSIKNLTDNYDPNAIGDQTLGKAECAIEFVLQRR